MSSTQLDATASVPGTFVYAPADGTVLDIGQHILHVDFTPDAVNYTKASKNVSIIILQATPTTPEITWSNPADIVYGTPLNCTQLDATASVPGTFVYTPADGTVLDIGQHTLHVDFTPDDAVNYTNSSLDVTINVLNASYSIFKSVIGVDETGDCILDEARDVLQYRIVVKNEGNVSLANVNVTDSMINITGPIGNGNEELVLYPGETWVYTGNYSVTEDDINNGTGYINNTAKVRCDLLPEKRSSASQPIDKSTDLAIYKSVTGIDEAGDHIINEVGDIIQYQIAVRNNGNVDLTNVRVEDPMIKLTKSGGDNNDPGVMNPREIWVYEGNYSVTQKDLDRAKGGSGFIENTATVSCDQLSNKSSSLDLPITLIPPIMVISGLESFKVLPAANFSNNVTKGYAPLSVQFIDLSQNTTLRSWDFNNDGTIDSSDANPIYTYTVPGTYTVKLTVGNANGSALKLATINVLQIASSNSGESSGGSSRGSSGASIGKAHVVSSSNDISNSNENTSATRTVTQNGNNAQSVEQNSTVSNVGQTPEQTPKQIQNSSTSAGESKKTPDFEMIYGIVCLLVVFLHKRK